MAVERIIRAIIIAPVSLSEDVVGLPRVSSLGGASVRAIEKGMKG